jgi:hypothetical protein
MTASPMVGTRARSVNRKTGQNFLKAVSKALFPG